VFVSLWACRVSTLLNPVAVNFLQSAMPADSTPQPNRRLGRPLHSSRIALLLPSCLAQLVTRGVPGAPAPSPPPTRGSRGQHNLQAVHPQLCFLSSQGLGQCQSLSSGNDRHDNGWLAAALGMCCNSTHNPLDCRPGMRVDMQGGASGAVLCSHNCADQQQHGPLAGCDQASVASQAQVCQVALVGNHEQVGGHSTDVAPICPRGTAAHPDMLHGLQHADLTGAASQALHIHT
jgi:hypothetical protein